VPAPVSPNFPAQLEGYVSSIGGQSFVTPPFRNLQLKGYEYLEELEQDTHLGGQLDLRFNSATNPGYQIDPASNSAQDQKIRDFVRDQFDNLDGTPTNALKKIWDAVPKGFSLVEPNFVNLKTGKWAGLYGLERLRHIPAKFVRFDFDLTGRVKPDGVVLYTNPATRWQEKTVVTGKRFKYADFIHSTHGQSDNPYGYPVDLRAAKWVWYKSEISKFWAYYAETFGAPALIVKYGQTSQARTDSASDEAKARQILADLRSFSGASMPRGFEIAMLEATRSGEPTYEALMTFCNKEISKVVVGATLVTEAGGKNSGASYAAVKGHGDVATGFSYSDALWLEFIVNSKLVRKLVDLNFRTETYPKFRLLEDNFANIIGLAQALQSLQAMGLDISEDWVYEWTSIPKPGSNSKVLVPVTNTPAPTAPQPNPDNKLRSADRVHQFGQDPISDLRQPESRTRKIDELASTAVFQFLRDIVEVFVQTAQKSLQEGVRPVEPAKLPTLNMGPLKRSLMASSTLYYLTGKAQAGSEVRQAGYELPESDSKLELPQALKPKTDLEKPFELAAAITAFKSLLPLRQVELNQLAGVLDGRYFQIAGLVRADLEKIWANQVLALRDGWSLREFEAAVKRDLIRYAGDIYGLETAGQPLLQRHLELIYRNGMNTGYADGIDSLATDPDVAQFLFGFKYIAIDDDRVRDDHIELDGITLPSDHEFWNFRTPPWDHNCRCTRQFIMQDQIDSGDVQPTPASQIPQVQPPNSGFIR